jgi:hypothetical protein
MVILVSLPFTCFFLVHATQVLQHPVASQADRDLTLVRGDGQSQNTYSIQSRVYRETENIKHEPGLRHVIRIDCWCSIAVCRHPYLTSNGG